MEARNTTGTHGHTACPRVRRNSSEWVPIVWVRNAKLILMIVSKHARDAHLHLQARLLKRKGTMQFRVHREAYAMLDATIISGGFNKLF